MNLIKIKSYKLNKSNMSVNDEELTRLAEEELLKEARKAAARAEIIGPEGWRKCPSRNVNKRFLVSTIRDAVYTNNYNKRIKFNNNHNNNKTIKTNNNHNNKQTRSNEEHEQEHYGDNESLNYCDYNKLNKTNNNNNSKYKFNNDLINNKSKSNINNTNYYNNNGDDKRRKR